MAEAESFKELHTVTVTVIPLSSFGLLFERAYLFFQCVVDFCQREKKCPHPDCSVSVTPDCSKIHWFKAILDEMFREYEAVYTPQAPKGSGKEILNITVLNGDATQIPYSSFMSMVDVQMYIKSKLNIPPNKQKILFEDKDVQVLICYYIYRLYINIYTFTINNYVILI